MLPLLLLATSLLAGCATDDAGAGGQGSSSGVWWVQKGVQCNEPAWLVGDDESQAGRPREAFERWPQAEQRLRAHYEQQGLSPQDVRVYMDDQIYPARCSGPSSWNYWMRLAQDDSPPDAGWMEGGRPSV